MINQDPATGYLIVDSEHESILNQLCMIVNDWAEKKGWNDDPVLEFLQVNGAPPELLIAHDVVVKAQECALITSEVSERLEFARTKNISPQGEHIDVMDDHVPTLTGEAAELADTVIRIFHYCGRRKINLGQALRLKYDYNTRRPYRHAKNI